MPLIAKKRGSTKMGRHSWMFEMKKKEEKRLEVLHQKLARRMITSAESFAQNHHTNGVEWRSADYGGGRRCHAIGQI